METTEESSKTIDELIAGTERIGSIGSPSSTTQLSLDIQATAVNRKLVGELAFFRFMQDNKPHYALGQITEIELRNVWLEDPTIRSLARQRGQVNPISGNQDNHLGKLSIGAVFKDEGSAFHSSILGTVPATGTPIQIANDAILDSLLERYSDQLYYMGNVYGSTTKLPFIFREFAGGAHGANDAYHIGVFGKTGSGKSTLAKMILIAYAKHPTMAIFVIDPIGEFSRNARGQVGTETFQLNLQEIFARLKKPVITTSVHEIILDRWDLFGEILYASPFYDRIIPNGENRQLAHDILIEQLQERRIDGNGIALAQLHDRRVFDIAWQILSDSNFQIQFYRTPSSRDAFNARLKSINLDHHYERIWNPIGQLFRTDRENVVSLDALIRQTFDTSNPNRPIVVIDISREQNEQALLFWNDTIQALIINRLLQGLSQQGLEAYRNSRFLNTLVILDEAQRLAKGEKMANEKQEQVRKFLIDAADTTRKYGLSWMFLSTSLSGLEQNIVRQMRIRFMGFGLALGSELDSIRELVGSKSALELYQTFRDPHSVFDQDAREYSFMVTGPVSPLASSMAPLFLTAFPNATEFLETNHLVDPKPKASK
jgi:ABC-type oligopeptide transport system ATPase subunit